MTKTASIPVIDISAQDVDQKAIAQQLVDAAVEHGFIYIRNLGRDISPGEIDGAFALVSLVDTWKRWQSSQGMMLVSEDV